MVYVVERYLPGLSRSDLLHELASLERTQELSYAAEGVRYLGSTIVLEDEACYCRFEGPTAAAVVEANRRAGLSFDRIVHAVTVTPKGEPR
jgi:Nickel responsive protein SCO4226-like